MNARDETEFDAIAIRSVKGRLKTPKFRSQRDNIINRNYGFDYDGNFLQMMVKMIGLSACEELDSDLAANGNLAILERNCGIAESTSYGGPRRRRVHDDYV